MWLWNHSSRMRTVGWSRGSSRRLDVAAVAHKKASLGWSLGLVRAWHRVPLVVLAPRVHALVLGRPSLLDVAAAEAFVGVIV